MAEPSVTKRASIFSQSVCGSEYHCSYAICCFKELATQNGSDLMGCLPSKDRSKKEQWSSCGDSPRYWSQDGSAVAIAEATRMGWLVRYGWCSVDGTSRVFTGVFCTLLVDF